jgi:hypothetical protein
MVTFTIDEEILELPNPILGDSEWWQDPSIVRRTSGQEILAVNDANWQTIERFNVTWRFLDINLVDDLLTFLYEHAGEQITYVDYRGDSFDVIVLTLNNNTIQEGRDVVDYPNAKGQRNISLELEVV